MAQLGLGSEFQREGATQGQYETIGYVASITPPQMEREVVEVEDLDPPDGVRQKLAGVIDAGEVSLTLNFDPTETGHTALEGDFFAGTPRSYRIKLPNGKGWTFDALVTGWSPQELTEGDVFQVEVTLTVVSKPTFGDIT